MRTQEQTWDTREALRGEDDEGFRERLRQDGGELGVDSVGSVIRRRGTRIAPRK